MPATTGELLALCLAFFGGFLGLLVLGAAIFEHTEVGRRLVDWVDRRWG